MKCPYCGWLWSHVTGKYKYKMIDDKNIRYRKCDKCGRNFRTVEEVVGVAKNGTIIDSGGINCENGNDYVSRS